MTEAHRKTPLSEDISLAFNSISTEHGHFGSEILYIHSERAIIKKTWGSTPKTETYPLPAHVRTYQDLAEFIEQHLPDLSYHISMCAYSPFASLLARTAIHPKPTSDTNEKKEVHNMSKKSIEQQIAELTPQQIGNMRKIYKRYALSLTAIVVVAVILTLSLFVHFSSEADKAQDHHDWLQTKMQLNEMNGTFDLSIYDESSNALDRYFDMKELQSTAIAISGAFILVGVLVVYLIFKSKHPYFSEKRYSKLKKMQHPALR